jgi:hypothetical protein
MRAGPRVIPIPPRSVGCDGQVRPLRFGAARGGDMRVPMDPLPAGNGASSRGRHGGAPPGGSLPAPAATLPAVPPVGWPLSAPRLRPAGPSVTHGVDEVERSSVG